MRLLSARTKVSDVAKNKNKGKRGDEAYEQRQLTLSSTQTRANEFQSTRTNTNEAHKHNINGKRGC
jgi:hypothetical protein